MLCTVQECTRKQELFTSTRTKYGKEGQYCHWRWSPNHLLTNVSNQYLSTQKPQKTPRPNQMFTIQKWKYQNQVHPILTDKKIIAKLIFINRNTNKNMRKIPTLCQNAPIVISFIIKGYVWLGQTLFDHLL